MQYQSRLFSFSVLLALLCILSACCSRGEEILGAWAPCDGARSEVILFYSNGLCVFQPSGAGSMLIHAPREQTGAWEYLPKERLYQISWTAGKRSGSIWTLSIQFYGERAEITTEYGVCWWEQVAG